MHALCQYAGVNVLPHLRDMYKYVAYFMWEFAHKILQKHTKSPTPGIIAIPV